jgi:hypothetical protein
MHAGVSGATDVAGHTRTFGMFMTRCGRNQDAIMRRNVVTAEDVRGKVEEQEI